MDREDRIRRRAYEIWEREGRPHGREQEHWDRAVQEIEAEEPEASRGPVAPDPAVDERSDPRLDVSTGDEPPVDDIYERSRDTPGATGETIPPPAPAEKPKRTRKAAPRTGPARG
jgi:hypothetical protein